MSDETDVQVKFGADTGGIESGADRVKEKVGEVGNEVEKAEELFKHLAERMAEVFAIHEITEFVEKIAEVGENIERITSMTGLSSEAVQSLGFAMERTGSNADGAGMMITRFERNVNQAAGGSGTAYAAFQKLGVSLHELQTSSIDQLIARTADGFRNLADPVERAAIASEIGGRGFAQLLPAILGSANGTKVFHDRLVELNDDLSEHTIKALSETKGNLTDFNKAVEGAGVQGLLTFKGAIDGTVQDLTAAVVVIGEVAGYLRELQTVAGEDLVIAFGYLGKEVDRISAEMSYYAKRIEIDWTEAGRIIKDVATKNWGDIALARTVAQAEIDQAGRNLVAGLQIAEGKYKDLKAAAEAAAKAMVEADHALGGDGESGLASRTGNGAGARSKPDRSADLEDIAEAEEIAKQKLQQQKDLYQQFVDLNVLSKQQALEDDKQAANDEYQIERDALEKKLALYDTDSDADVAAYNKTAGQIEVLAEKHNTAMAKLDLQEAAAREQALKETTKSYTDFFNTIDKSLDSMLQGVLQGTQTWQMALAKVFDNMALSFIEDIAKMALKWAAFEAAQGALGAGSKITQGLSTQVPGALGGASTASGGVTGAMMAALTAAIGLNTTTTLTAAQIDALCNVSTDANTAANTLNASATSANTASSVSQLLSNTGATITNTAATLYNTASKALPSFDVGSWSVPGDMVAQIHQGEMIIPAQQAGEIRSGATSIGTGGGSSSGGGAITVNLNISAIDTQTGTAFLKSNMNVIAQGIAAQVRNSSASLQAWKS